MDTSFVIAIERAGKNPPPGVMIAAVTNASKKEALLFAESNFRKELGLSTSVAVSSKVVFEGSPDDCRIFHKRLMVLLDEKTNGRNHD